MNRLLPGERELLGECQEHGPVEVEGWTGRERATDVVRGLGVNLSQSPTRERIARLPVQRLRMNKRPILVKP